MKKILPWVFIVSLVAFLIDWGIVGLKIMDGEYDFTALVYVALALLVVMFGCLKCSASILQKWSHRINACKRNFAF